MKKILFPVLATIALQLTISTGYSQMIKGGGIFKDTTELSKFVDSLFYANSFSGIVAISKGDQIIYTHSNGFANKKEKTPVSLKTIFNMGSMTKMFTGVAIMQLVERNKIKLTDPVSKYLPEYPDKEWAGKATIQTLLTHTSGMGEFFPHGHKFKNFYNLQEIIDTIAKIVTTGSPTEKMVYSNAGFYLLGRIIEKISGRNYFDYIQKNIFDVAGMKNTYFKASGRDKRFAKGYMLNENTGKYETNENVINKIGGPPGGSMTNISDLLAFQIALKNNKLITEKSFKTMTEIKVKGDRGMAYGLGIGVGSMPNGANWIGHNGGGPGISVNYAWFIDNEYSVIVFMNQDAKSNMPLMMRSHIFVSGMK